MELMKRYTTGWRKAISKTPEHEVDFHTIDACLGYLRDELTWLATDLPTDDSVGDDAIRAAQEMMRMSPDLSSLFHGYREWRVGEFVYFVKLNPIFAAIGKAGV